MDWLLFSYSDQFALEIRNLVISGSKSVRVWVWSKYSLEQVQLMTIPKSAHHGIAAQSQSQCGVWDWYSIHILEVMCQRETFSHVYSAHIHWLSHIYPMFIQDVSPDMSVSPTGRSEGRNGGCKHGSRASETVESCSSSSIRQDKTLRSAGHCVARVSISQKTPGAPVSDNQARWED